jgi:dihydrofolate reductase
MGRNTWESLPVRPLRGRQNIVIANRETLPGADAVVMSLDDALACADTGRSAWVIGGASLYNYAKTDPRCTVAHITLVEHTGECDTFVDIKGICDAFPNKKEVYSLYDNNIATMYCVAER